MATQYGIYGGIGQGMREASAAIRAAQMMREDRRARQDAESERERVRQEARDAETMARRQQAENTIDQARALGFEPTVSKFSQEMIGDDMSQPGSLTRGRERAAITYMGQQQAAQAKTEQERQAKKDALAEQYTRAQIANMNRPAQPKQLGPLEYAKLESQASELAMNEVLSQYGEPDIGSGKMVIPEASRPQATAAYNSLKGQYLTQWGGGGAPAIRDIGDVNDVGAGGQQQPVGVTQQPAPTNANQSLADTAMEYAQGDNKLAAQYIMASSAPEEEKQAAIDELARAELIGGIGKGIATYSPVSGAIQGARFVGKGLQAGAQYVGSEYEQALQEARNRVLGIEPPAMQGPQEPPWYRKPGSGGPALGATMQEIRKPR